MGTGGMDCTPIVYFDLTPNHTFLKVTVGDIPMKISKWIDKVIEIV